MKMEHTYGVLVAKELRERLERNESAAILVPRVTLAAAATALEAFTGTRIAETNLRGAIVLLRKAFRDDGAEGESVHLVCDAIELVASELEAARKIATYWHGAFGMTDEDVDDEHRLRSRVDGETIARWFP